jgi:DNA-binding transcriptional LysR family regulator
VELYALRVFSTVVSERSFSRAAEKLFRTQPAVSLAVQRLETELGEKLIDRDMRGAKELVLTDAGRVVFEHARRFNNLELELASALAELRDRSAGRLAIGANESSTLYLLPHIERYRGRFPKIKVQIRRSQSSKIPAQLVEGDLVQAGEGVAFLPRMCVRQDVETGAVREVTVKELHVERKVRLLYAKARTLSHAAKAFLDLVDDA